MNIEHGGNEGPLGKFAQAGKPLVRVSDQIFEMDRQNPAGVNVLNKRRNIAVALGPDGLGKGARVIYPALHPDLIQSRRDMGPDRLDRIAAQHDVKGFAKPGLKRPERRRRQGGMGRFLDDPAISDRMLQVVIDPLYRQARGDGAVNPRAGAALILAGR